MKLSEMVNEYIGPILMKILVQRECYPAHLLQDKRSLTSNSLFS